MAERKLRMNTHSQEEAQRILRGMRASGDFELKMKPGPECRREAVELFALHYKSERYDFYGTTLEWGLISVENSLGLVVDPGSDRVRPMDAAGIDARDIAYAGIGQVVNDSVTGLAGSSVDINMAIAWGMRSISTEVRLCLQYGWSSASAFTIFPLHGVTLAHGAAKYSDWLTRYIFNAYAAGSSSFESLANGENDFSEFYWRLIVALVDGSWPSPEKLDSADFGLYRPLMKSVTDPQAFSKELLTYLDHRVARSYMFPYCGAPSRDRRDVSYMPAGPVTGLYPFELIALKAAVRRTLKIDIDLNVDHPLVQSPFFKSPPAVNLNYRDALLDRFDARARSEFGLDWRLLPSFELINAD